MRNESNSGSECTSGADQPDRKRHISNHGLPDVDCGTQRQTILGPAGSQLWDAGEHRHALRQWTPRVGRLRVRQPAAGRGAHLRAALGIHPGSQERRAQRPGSRSAVPIGRRVHRVVGEGGGNDTGSVMRSRPGNGADLTGPGPAGYPRTAPPGSGRGARPGRQRKGRHRIPLV